MAAEQQETVPAEVREQHQLLEFSEDRRVVVFDMYHLVKYMR